MSTTRATHPFDALLFRLALRRALPPSLALLALVVVVLAATRDWSVPATLIESDLAGRATQAFTRQGVWLACFLVVVPLVLARAAVVPTRWRLHDAAWLGPRPVSRWSVVLTSFVASWTAGAVLVVVTAIAAELAAEASPAARFVTTLEHPACVLLAGDDGTSFLLADHQLPEGAALRLRPTVSPGAGPGATVTFRVRRDTASEERTVTIHGRTSLVVPIPIGPIGPGGPGGDLLVELERVRGGAVVLLPSDHVDVLLPAASDGLASVELALRTLTALGAWIALVLGFGAWMGAGYAFLLVLALWFVPWWWGLGRDLLPGGDLFAAWTHTGAGLVPSATSATAVVTSALVVVVGLLSSHAGTRDWRSGR